MKTITRADVAETIYEEIGLSRKDSNDILDMILDEIVQELSAGNDTGVEAEISPRRVISFKPSQTMRKIINA